LLGDHRGKREEFPVNFRRSAGAVAGFVATLLILELTNFVTPADPIARNRKSYSWLVDAWPDSFAGVHV
jgi:hypothetical protein